MSQTLELSSIVESLEELNKQLHSFLLDKELIGLAQSTAILDNLQTIVEVLNTKGVGSTLDVYKAEPKNPVERYNCQEIVLTQYQEGADYITISRYLSSLGYSIKANDISNWIEIYNSTSILAKSEMKYGDVFDTTGQLQRLFNILNDELVNLERVDPEELRKSSIYEIKLQYMSEIRATLKDAAQLSQAINNLNEIDNYKKVVFEEIRKLSPETALTIVQRLKSVKALHASI